MSTTYCAAPFVRRLYLLMTTTGFAAIAPNCSNEQQMI